MILGTNTDGSRGTGSGSDLSTARCNASLKGSTDEQGGSTDISMTWPSDCIVIITMQGAYLEKSPLGGGFQLL